VSDQDVDEGSEYDSAVAAEKRIGEESPKQRKQGSSSRPHIHVLCGGGRALTERPCQIRYHVPLNPIIRNPLRHFHA